ncbi:MAG: ATP synthase F1 subunit gamma [Alphaproteobacteria bacterium]|nr:ATP synthase F1 subunit gamma [Alphaproteobacteria bacterium]
MAGLKELRTRIESIKSTQKITSAMKMVAAARLRKAQMLTDSASAYSESIAKILARAGAGTRERIARGEPVEVSAFMKSKEQAKNYLLVVFTSDRGLCGSYNANVAKIALQRLNELKQAGKEVKVLCIGRKGRDIIRRFDADRISSCIEGVARKGASYAEASLIAEQLCNGFLNNEFDVCEVVYSRFHSVMNREIKAEQFLPAGAGSEEISFAQPELVNGAEYEYEPQPDELVNGLVDNYIKAAFFAYIINSQASEQGARMTSMDNATRNAKDMISKLTLKYNRMRQTSITTELIEIIAGAEAL